MQTQISRFPNQTRRLIRHKLDEHKKLQKLTQGKNDQIDAYSIAQYALRFQDKSQL